MNKNVCRFDISMCNPLRMQIFKSPQTLMKNCDGLFHSDQTSSVLVYHIFKRKIFHNQHRYRLLCVIHKLHNMLLLTRKILLRHR